MAEGRKIENKDPDHKFKSFYSWHWFIGVTLPLLPAEPGRSLKWDTELKKEFSKRK